MEEKNPKKCGSFRAIFSRRFSNKPIFFRTNNSIFFGSNLGRFSGSSGFTLIELLVVLGLIGILAAAFIIYINPAKQLSRARDGHRKSDLQQIRSALELYRADCGSYPPDTGNILASPLTSSCTGNTITYMQNVPKDPKSDGSYWYDVNASGGYGMAVCLENKDDPDGASHPTCPSRWAYSVYNP